MTETQKQILKDKVLAAAMKKDVPQESARWHMAHRPYGIGGDADGDDKGAAETVPQLQRRDQGA